MSTSVIAIESPPRSPIDEMAAASIIAPVTEENRSKLFAQIYTDHLGIVWKTARAFASSQQDQADLVQEILVSVWEATEEFQHRAKLSTYVYRIAYHQALNWKRKNRRYVEKIAAFGHNFPHLSWEDTDDQAQSRLRWLYRAINRLRPIDKTVCLLYLDGLSHTEMADVLGISEANVSIRVHRLKRQLTKLMKKDHAGF